MTCNDIDWAAWQPQDRAAIVYICDRRLGRVLLIHKKTGIGQGKVSAPGGRLDDGESFLDAVIRECVEEVSVTPLKAEKRVELHFQFTNGYSMYGEAFFTDTWEGEALPSSEAEPFWCGLDALPWDDMWDDDRHWLLDALSGKKLRGWFVFDAETDKLLSMKLEDLRG